MARTYTQSLAGAPEREAVPVDAKLGRKPFERELAKLHAELVKLQLWVVETWPVSVGCLRGRDARARAGSPARTSPSE